MWVKLWVKPLHADSFTHIMTKLTDRAIKKYPFGRTILAGRGSLTAGPHMTRYRENFSRAC